ncbi:MAG: glycosyltransferase family 4 protein [Gemmatimonadetes bacterium]|nr:glycosyltransferase family 4 protein [Gemmatimonadota bacterium]
MSALATPPSTAPGPQQAGGGVPPRAPEAVVLDWQIGTGTGWQVFGLNLALQLACDGRVVPLLLEPVDPALLAPLHRHALALSLAQQAELRGMLAAVGSAGLDCDYPVLRALGNGFQGNPAGATLRSARDLGVIFFEDTALTPDALARARRLDCIIAGSAWNGALLRAAGLPRVHVIPQGIDPTIFHPAERSGLLRDRFVVFSGGKLEYRKGQDLVIAAFRAFRQRHPEALLLTAWHNPWPQTLVGLDSAGHVRGLPGVDQAGRLQLLPWLAANGVPAGSVLDVGALPNHQMAATVREADVALFPNRCEGGTNLVAMEAMACGVPALVAANSGQLDLLAEPEAAVPLTRQGPPRGACPFYQGREGWGESDVEEMLEALEAAWQHREAMQERGRRAAAWMARAWSWRSRTQEVLGVLGA